MFTRTTTRIAAYVLLVLAGVIGGGGLLAFMLFLFAGSFNLVDLRLGEFPALLLNALLCLAFFIQHSSMARQSFYQRSERFLPAHFGGAVYAVASGVVVLALVVFWQESAYRLLAPQGFVRWIFRAILVLAFAGVAWTIWTLGLFTNFRLRSTVAELRSTEPQAASLITYGPYRWVRHPLYLSALLMIWSYPDLTLDRLLLNVSFTVWVIAATRLEERKLVATFGEEYRNYQLKVPMLIPWPLASGRHGEIRVKVVDNSG